MGAAGEGVAARTGSGFSFRSSLLTVFLTRATPVPVAGGTSPKSTLAGWAMP